MIITLSDNGFDTMDPIYIETGLGIVIAMCLAIAVGTRHSRGVAVTSEP